MKKKISLKYYRNPQSTEIVEIDYNELNQDYYTKSGKRRWLLGSAEDRIEAYLLRKNWIKINITTFNKLKDGFEQEQGILQYGNSLGGGIPEPKQRAKKV